MFLLINFVLSHFETSSIVVLQYSCCFTLLLSSELDVASVTATYLPAVIIVKLGSRSKVHLKSLIRDLDLELEAIIAMPPPPPPTIKLF